MTLSERYSHIIGYFRDNVPVAESELHFNTPYELLVSVILSAQCTDKRVNMTTPELFARYPDAEALSQAEEEDIYQIIKSISYPHNKARHLYSLGRKLMSSFRGEIPSKVEDLMTLPGVGRKTANVVASIIFNEPVIAVDTHVGRVSRRLGLSKGRTPDAVERDLEKNIPGELRPIAHHWLILHGRYICTARSPKCGECPLSAWCKSYSPD